MNPSIELVAAIAIVWFGIFVFSLALFRVGAQPLPPVRRRLRLVRSRDRIGVVEILPDTREPRR